MQSLHLYFEAFALNEAPSRPRLGFECTGMPNEVRIRVKEKVESSIGALKSQHLADGFAAAGKLAALGLRSTFAQRDLERATTRESRNFGCGVGDGIR
jgi:hypothetical protein